MLLAACRHRLFRDCTKRLGKFRFVVLFRAGGGDDNPPFWDRLLRKRAATGVASQNTCSARRDASKSFPTFVVARIGTRQMKPGMLAISIGVA